MGFCVNTGKSQSANAFFEKYEDSELSNDLAKEIDSILISDLVLSDTSFPTKINALILKGQVERKYGNSAAAISVLYEAIELLDTSTLHELKSLAFHRTSLVFYKMGDISSSIKYNRLAVKLSKSNNDKNYTKYLGDYAMMLAENGNIDSAAIFWNEIISYYKQTEEKPKIYFNTLMNLAILYEWDENFVEARAYYKIALDYFSRTKNYRLMTVCYDNLAGNFADNLLFDSAKYYFLKAQKTNEFVRSLPSSLSLAENLSRMYEATNDFEEALKWEKKRFNLNDSLKSTEALVQIGTIEEQYKNKIEEDRINRREAALKAKAERQANIQFFGIFLGIVFLFIMVFALGFIKLTVPLWLANSIVFFAFVLLFEFLLVVLDPTIDGWSDGKPIIKLACNVALAVLIIPLHTLFEGKLRRYLTK